MSRISTDESRRRESGFASGLFWGTAMGAIGMFLFGTKRGRKIREYLKEHGGKLLDELEETYAVIEDKHHALSFLGEGKQAPEKKRGPMVSPIASLQERGRKAARHFFTRGGRALK